MDKYRIRRSILQALKDLEPAPATVSDLEAYPLLSRVDLPRAVVVDELLGLVDHGYVENLRPTRAPLYRLTAAGRDQIRQDAELAEYVWGELAL